MAKTKVCPKCGIEKDRSEFYKHRSRKDGLTSYCKICHSVYVNKWQKNNLDKVRKSRGKSKKKYNEKFIEYQTGTKVCTKCGIEKDNSEFYKHMAYKDGLHSFCKTCHLAAQKKYQKANLERFRDYNRQWRKENPDRTKEYTNNWRKKNPKI